MDNAIYVGLSRQIVLQRALDIAANNLANTDTTGYKFEELMTNPEPVTTARTVGISSPVVFVVDAGVARDFTQGSMLQTGGPLDVAIAGRGFFQVSTSGGMRFTRDGRFKLDPAGKLVTQDGDAVQGEGGDIVLDPKKGPVTISPSGIVSQNGERVAKLSVVDFPDLSVLSKDGNNSYANPTGVVPLPAASATLQQGMLEGSNVRPVTQITRLIQINRAYDAMANMINGAADLSKSAVQRLGSTNP